MINDYLLHKIRCAGTAAQYHFGGIYMFLTSILPLAIPLTGYLAIIIV
jgi:hypothetical protein